MTTISQHIADLNAQMATQVPAEAMAVFGADVQRFAGTEVPSTGIRVGDSLPHATVLDAAGSEVEFHSLLTHDQNVVVVYRGSWCPYCNVTLRAYQNDLVPALTERGVGLVALTIQKPEGLELMTNSHDLSFGAYSDHRATIIDALGVWTTPSDDVAQLQAEFGMRVPELNIDGTTRLPMPTTLIVDRTGLISFIDVRPNFTDRTEVADILAAL